MVRRAGWLATAAVLLCACTPGAEQEPPTERGPDPQRQELERLRAELDAQRQLNDELSGEVSWLRQQLDLLADFEPAAPAPEEDSEGDEAAQADANAAEPQEKVWFDDQALLANGLPPDEVERLREVFESSEMAMLELDHQARREGWARTPRYRQERRALQIGLRTEIGDEAFDLMLFATGRPNRVLIANVLRDSPGERAGLQPGDVILSYGERRIFHPNELRSATTTGKLGENVRVDLLRDGETMRIYAQRGPIGVRLDRARMLPELR